MVQELKNYKNAYHLDYFTSADYLEVFRQQKQTIDDMKSMNKSDVIYFLCNRLINDYQHHHLGNTLSYTPLRDIRLAKYFMQLPTESLIGQIINGDITRKLIRNNDASLLQYVSTSKNFNEFMSNLSELLGKTQVKIDCS